MESGRKKPIAPIIPTRSANQLGQALERYRKLTKFTQTRLAKSAGLRQATISKTEKGLGSTEIKTIFSICAALNLELVLRPRPGANDDFDPEDVFGNERGHGKK